MACHVQAPTQDLWVLPAQAPQLLVALACAMALLEAAHLAPGCATALVVPCLLAQACRMVLPAMARLVRVCAMAPRVTVPLDRACATALQGQVRRVPWVLVVR